MNTIDPDLFSKLMLLPVGARLELLEFLGATPVGQEQLDTMIEEFEASIKFKLQANTHGHN